MASGMADYQRIVRPKYGAALISHTTAVVTANDRKTLVSVSGKGMIYGGYFALDYTSIQENSQPELRIDGNVIAQAPFMTLNKYGLSKTGSGVVTINVFDNTSFIYCVGLSYGLTFESLVELIYYEKHGTTPAVSAALVYALL